MPLVTATFASSAPCPKRTPVRQARLAALALACAVAVSTTGCGGTSVSVSAPAPSGSAAVEMCSALKDSLPTRLGGLRAAKTTPESDFTAAWVDAASSVVTLRCGVASFDTATSDILSVNDVDWAPIQRDRGTTFVTVGRQVAVQVDVPVALRPEASYLVPLADAVSTAVPLGN